MDLKPALIALRDDVARRIEQRMHAQHLGEAARLGDKARQQRGRAAPRARQSLASTSEGTLEALTKHQVVDRAWRSTGSSSMHLMP